MTKSKQTAQTRRGVGRPFAPGQSGNPKGRPKGSHNLGTLLIEKLEGRGEEIIDAVIERAQQGDPTFIKMIMDKTIPAAKGPLITFDMPEPNEDGSMDLPKVHEAIFRACSEGQISGVDAEHLSTILKNISTERNASTFVAKAKELEDKVNKIAQFGS